MDVNELLRFTVERGASDLHLKVGNVPFVRVDGELQPTHFEELTAEDTDGFGDVLMSDHKKREFNETNEADLGYTLKGVGRFRVNVYRQRGVLGLAIRRVRSEIPTFEELRLPPVMGQLALPGCSVRIWKKDLFQSAPAAAALKAASSGFTNSPSLFCSAT